MTVRPCDQCHALFLPRAPHQRYCSGACRQAGCDRERRERSALMAARQRRAPSCHDPVDRSGDIEARYLAALRRIRARERHRLDVWAQSLSYASQMAPCGPALDEDEDEARV